MRSNRSLFMFVASGVAVCLLAMGCSSGEFSEPTIRLVDRFEADSVEGSPTTRAPEPAALWDFAAGDDGSALGWKAGTGISGFRLAEGHLTGRTTSNFPLIYAPVPESVDPSDDLHSIEVRLRSDKEGELGVYFSSDTPNLERITRGFAPPPSAAVSAGDSFQTVTVSPARPTSIGGIKYLTVRLLDSPGAKIDVERIRMVSQQEHRAAIPSGVGWQGLSSIYRETIVSRSPEVVSIDLNIPSDAWLDLNLGAVSPDPVTFKIATGGEDSETVILRHTVTTPHRWEAVPVDLSAHAGARTLRLSLDVEEQRTIGFWGSPAIRVRNARPQTRRTPAVALGGAQAPRGVIFIMGDTLRKDHLKLYGHERQTSPHLASLASQGTLFLDNIAQATWTKASTPSIMTSLYPRSTRVHGVPDRLSAAAVTLAEVYREAGYATVSYSANSFTGKFTNLHQGFEELHEGTSVEEERRLRAKTARPYVDRALDWIERHPGVPFFIYLHFFDPHHPFEPRAPYNTTWADPAHREKHEQQREQAREYIEEAPMRRRGLPNPGELKKAGLDANQWLSYEQDWYDGSILGMDAEIGRLIQRLRQLGLAEDTLVVFFSDHGEEWGERGRLWHGQSVYAELTNVPMLFYWPGVIPAGLEISETVRNIDLMPTVLDLTGLAVPESVQGQSLVPLMAAARQAGKADEVAVTEVAANLGWTPQPAVSEKSDDPHGEYPRHLLSYGIVFDGWKLIHNPKRGDDRPEYELYSHADDPMNKRNVLDKHPEIAEDLKAKLASWHEMAEQGMLPKAGSTEDLPEEELERLRSLGYIQ